MINSIHVGESTLLEDIVENVSDDFAFCGGIETIVPFAEGNANHNFLVNGKYVLKVQRTDTSSREANPLEQEGKICELFVMNRHLPTFVFVNSDVPCYCTTLMGGNPLKQSFSLLDGVVKSSLGAELGDFLHEFHHQQLPLDGLPIRSLKNYPMLRDGGKDVFAFAMRESFECQKIMKEMIDVVHDDFEFGKDMVLTHSDFHWKNILVDDEHCLSGVVDFGNVMYDSPEVDFRQMMGRYDFEFGKDMVLEYERLSGELNRPLLYGHCGLADFWRYREKYTKDLDSFVEKWDAMKEVYLTF